MLRHSRMLALGTHMRANFLLQVAEIESDARDAWGEPNWGIEASLSQTVLLASGVVEELLGDKVRYAGRDAFPMKF
jgi:hypothetical protein